MFRNLPPRFRIMKVFQRLISKLIRYFLRKTEDVLSLLRSMLTEAKYPGCDLSGTVIGKNVHISCSDGSSLILTNSYISDGAHIVVDYGGSLIADHIFVGKFSVIVACDEIQIGKDTLIAEMVVIRDQNHSYSDPNRPIKEQELSKKPIIVGKNVWLGAKVTVLAGAVIGDDVVIGAHAVVRGTLPPGSVAVGIPAVIKKVVSPH